MSQEVLSWEANAEALLGQLVQILCTVSSLHFCTLGTIPFFVCEFIGFANGEMYCLWQTSVFRPFDCVVLQFYSRILLVRFSSRVEFWFWCPAIDSHPVSDCTRLHWSELFRRAWMYSIAWYLLWEALFVYDIQIIASDVSIRLHWDFNSSTCACTCASSLVGIDDEVIDHGARFCGAEAQLIGKISNAMWCSGYRFNSAMMHYFKKASFQFRDEL
jgi:hypothetical protein